MITRWKRLFDTQGTPDDISWPDLFEEFSRPKAYEGEHHPGWSAATFEPPVRNLGNVREVHAVVLDYDDGVTIDEAAETWKLYYGFVHTTRKHTADAHRFRVILPLSRPVSKFEYTALWEIINQHAGGKVDKAPKDPSRFWYTPGLADIPEACFETRLLDGAFLEPDEWLARTVPAPKPADVLPLPRDAERRARAYIAKMPPAISGQHGHDACWAVARKLVCDFGLNEETAYRILASEYNPKCSPPWSEKELRHKVHDASTKARVVNPVENRTFPPTLRQAPLPIGNTAPETAPDADWLRLLRQKQDGNLTKDTGNVSLVLTHDERWKGCLEYNAFADQITWARTPPELTGFDTPQPGEALADHHAVYVHHWLAKYYNVAFSKQSLWDGLAAAAHNNSRHPLQDYLRSCQWDGVSRLDGWLHTYLGAEPSPYVTAVGRWWMLSAVARAFEPGCQADYMLILEGRQGARKSTTAAILGDPWYTGTLPDVRDRAKAVEALQGVWVVEIAEMDAFRGAGATRIKDFVTQRFDDYRAAYARCKQRRPRTCVFIGTTNEDTYLQDHTGARRFWPVACAGLRREALIAERDLLWAEARIAYESGDQWWPDARWQSAIESEQEARYVGDEWEGRISEWVRDRDGFSAADVLSDCLSLEPAKWDKPLQTRVGQCLRRLGYITAQRREHGARVRRYFLPEVSQSEGE